MNIVSSVWFLILSYSLRISLADDRELQICDFDEQLHRLLQTDPWFKATLDGIDGRWLLHSGEERERRRLVLESLLPNPIIIPINFHIIVPPPILKPPFDNIYGDQFINNGKSPFYQVGYERIISQLTTLNKAFMALNDDLPQTGEFAQFVGNFSVRFSLNKIIRTYTDIDVHKPTTAKSSVSGGSDSVDGHYVLNIWLCLFEEESLLGSATPPGVVMDIDGIVLNMFSFGNVDDIYQPNYESFIPPLYRFYARGALNGLTAVHEVGHWFNLRHMWDDYADLDDTDPCDYDDLVPDTPATIVKHFECPSDNTTIASCGTNDMYMNYMDYTPCTTMFTKGQVKRGRDLFTIGGARERLVQYHYNAANVVYVDYFYFIQTNDTDPECNVGHRLVDLDANNGTTSAYKFYLCVSYSNNPYTDIITDITLIKSSSQSCPSKTYEKIDTNLNYGNNGDEIYVCYKKQSQCAPTDAIVDITLFSFVSLYTDDIYNQYTVLPTNLNSGTGSTNYIYFGYKRDDIEPDPTLCYEEITYGDIKSATIAAGEILKYQVILHKQTMTFYGRTPFKSSIRHAHFTIDGEEVGNVAIAFLDGDMKSIQTCQNCTQLMVDDIEPGRYLLFVNVSSQSDVSFKLSMEHGTMSCGDMIMERFGGWGEIHYYRIDSETDYEEVYFESCGSKLFVSAVMGLYNNEMNLIAACSNCTSAHSQCGQDARDFIVKDWSHGTYFLKVAVDQTSFRMPSRYRNNAALAITFQMICPAVEHEYTYFDVCGFKYADDGVPKTWRQAIAYCNKEFGTSTAMPDSEESGECMTHVMSIKYQYGVSLPWFGVYHADDGTFESAYLEKECDTDTDYPCDKTLTAVLCRSNINIASVPSKSWFNNMMDYNYNHYMESDHSNSVYGFNISTVFALVLGFFGGASAGLICLLYWCLLKRRANHKRAKYDLVSIAQEFESDY